MTECNFTTVLWRILLQCLSHNSNQWGDMLDATRSNYEKLMNQYRIDPYGTDETDNKDTENVNHPLSRDENVM